MAKPIPPMPGITRVNFLKIPIDVVPASAIPEAVDVLIKEGSSHHIVLLNLRSLLKARRNRDFRAYVLGASLVIPVSHAIVRGLQFVSSVQTVRWMPFDFVIQLLTALEAKNRTVYLLGAKKRNLLAAERNLRQTFPQLRIVGRFNGFFRRNREYPIITGIRKAAPSLLLVGHGIAGGNLWIYRNVRQLGPGLKIWCGNLFDVFSERRRKPSKKIYDKGLEGLVACLKNPFLCLRIFPWLYYNHLLLFYRLFKRR